MTFTIWYIIIGLLLIGMALSGGLVKRLPLTTSMLYLGLGVVLGPLGLGLIRFDPVDWAAVLERVSEVAVIGAIIGWVVGPPGGASAPQVA